MKKPIRASVRSNPLPHAGKKLKRIRARPGLYGQERKTRSKPSTPNGETNMKTIIAATLILASGITQAQSFDYEKAVGSAELYSTLATEGVVSVNTGDSGGFAYQESVGSADLFPTLIGPSAAPKASSGDSVFAYQRAVGSNELDPSLS
jgi:hypothetical protein